MFCINAMPKEIIKVKNKTNYLMADKGIWVRDFTSFGSNVDESNLFHKEEYGMIVENEVKNKSLNKPKFDFKSIKKENIIIVSSGFDFKEKHKLLNSVSKDTMIIGTNRVLREWSLVGEKLKPSERRGINFYVINNPYNDCSNFLPLSNYYPRCISSIRTNHKFVKEYKNDVLFYAPQRQENFSVIEKGMERIDDYRNPICAAINLSWVFEAKKILLLFCDDSFIDNKQGSVKLENGMYCYEQQITAQKIIDSMCYWLRSKNIKIGYNSCGKKMKNAEYINLESINDFFKE